MLRPLQWISQSSYLPNLLTPTLVNGIVLLRQAGVTARGVRSNVLRRSRSPGAMRGDDGARAAAPTAGRVAVLSHLGCNHAAITACRAVRDALSAMCRRSKNGSYGRRRQGYWRHDRCAQIDALCPRSSRSISKRVPAWHRVREQVTRKAQLTRPRSIESAACWRNSASSWFHWVARRIAPRAFSAISPEDGENGFAE